MSEALSPKKALIFRITHVDNVPWILEHGLHAQSANVLDPNFVGIGLEGLIERRKTRAVEISPFGVLADYVPFYFTPYSKMMYNIYTGYRGVTKRPNEDIVILTTSIYMFDKKEIPFVFTDGHAYVKESRFFNRLPDLKHIDWEILQRRSFYNDPEDPGKGTRYQAEALAHRHVPMDALLGVVCYNKSRAKHIGAMVAERALELKIVTKPEWYFT